MISILNFLQKFSRNWCLKKLNEKYEIFLCEVNSKNEPTIKTNSAVDTIRILEENTKEGITLKVKIHININIYLYKVNRFRSHQVDFRDNTNLILLWSKYLPSEESFPKATDAKTIKDFLQIVCTSCLHPKQSTISKFLQPNENALDEEVSKKVSLFTVTIFISSTIIKLRYLRIFRPMNWLTEIVALVKQAQYQNEKMIRESKHLLMELPHLEVKMRTKSTKLE